MSSAAPPGTAFLSCTLRLPFTAPAEPPWGWGGPGPLPHRHTPAQPSLPRRPRPPLPSGPRGSRRPWGGGQPCRRFANARLTSGAAKRWQGRGRSPGSRAPTLTAAAGTGPVPAPQPAPGAGSPPHRTGPGSDGRGRREGREGTEHRAGAPRRGGGGQDSPPRGPCTGQGLTSPGRYRPGVGRAHSRAAPCPPDGPSREAPTSPHPVPSRHPSYRRSLRSCFRLRRPPSCDTSPSPDRAARKRSRGPAVPGLPRADYSSRRAARRVRVPAGDMGRTDMARVAHVVADTGAFLSAAPLQVPGRGGPGGRGVTGAGATGAGLTALPAGHRADPVHRARGAGRDPRQADAPPFGRAALRAAPPPPAARRPAPR